MKRLLPILALALTTAFAGCAQQPVRITLNGAEKSAKVPLKDLRPESEKQKEIFSLLISSSAYGIYRLADDTLSPPVIDLLKHRAYEKLGTKGPLNIVVHHLVVYLNAKSQLRYSAIGGLVGAAIAAKSSVNISQTAVNRQQFEAMAAEEHRRAFYTSAENPQNAAVLVIYVDAEINGKRTFIKTLSPNTAPEGQVPVVLAAESTISYFLSKY